MSVAGATFVPTKAGSGERIWRLGTAAIVFAFAADPLGTVPNVAALALLLLAALQVFATNHETGAINVPLLTLAGIIIVIAALEILNPNVPSLTVGLLGFRKTATFALGIVIGLGWRGSRMQGLRVVWWCMFVAASASLVVHLALPSVEQSITRHAGKYTSLLAGESRMQGLFSGPFHVSMLGVFLFLAALAPGLVIRQRWLRVASAAVGLACVYFAQVRTGLVAVGIGVVVMMVVTGSARRWLGRIAIVAVSVVLAVICMGPLTEYARQFTALRTLLDYGVSDTRFGQRYTTWSESLTMIADSPLVGFGSGSAGDTLGTYFLKGEHITSHNTFLKYAVEGGVVQGLLFVALCVGLLVALRPRRDPTCFGVVAAVSFFVFAFVIAAPESLPVSLALAVIMGLCVGRTHPAQSTDEVS